MSVATLIFLLGFAVLTVFSLIPAVQRELTDRRRFRRLLARYEHQLASHPGVPKN